jgi:predicted dehydrogenase
MIRVGIAGIGFMGMTHFNAYKHVPQAKVVALCEKDPVRLAGDWRSIKGNFGPQGEVVDLEGFAKYADLQKMVQDPAIDLVDLCLPPSSHAAAAMTASKAGKHVLCEKAIALHPQDADRMVETARRAGKMLLIAHVLPFVPEYKFAYRAVVEGTYGRFLGGSLKRVISDPLWLKDFYDPDGCGGPMVDLHIHDAHFVRLICGMPKSVRSIGRMRGKVAEYFTTQFLFEDPALVVTATSGVIHQQGRPFTHGYELHFEKATLAFESGMEFPLTVYDDKGGVVRPELGAPDILLAFPQELNEAVGAIENSRPSPLLDGSLARDALVLCQKQTESIVTGQPVKV